MIRVVLPRTSADAGAASSGEVQLDVEGRSTQRSVLDALEARYPMLRGTIRDHVTQTAPAVRAVLRLRARTCPTSRPTTPLPDAVASGAEPFLIVGAMAGG